MLSRILALSALSLSLACQSSTTEQSGAVDALDDFEKDFFVAFGDPASWTAEGGVFQCNGTPNGYLCTKKSYSNYVLTLEFRYPEQAGNSGVFHYTPESTKSGRPAWRSRASTSGWRRSFPWGAPRVPEATATRRRGPGPQTPLPNGTGSRSPRGTA